MSVFLLYFGWPAGAVWSNLLASAVSAALVWWRIRARQIAQHAEALAQAARHHKMLMAQAAEHHEMELAALRSHCSDLKEHVTATRPASSVVVDAPQLPSPRRPRGGAK